MENNPYPQTTTANPKTSGLAIASLVCGIFGLLLLPGLLGLILAIKAINQIDANNGAISGKGLAMAGLATSGISTIISLILASMLLPALANAKAKANRIKCVNNLGSIGKSLIGFADENDQRLPWQLTKVQQASHKFNSPGIGARRAAQVVNIAAMRSKLQTPKILHSPCDPERTTDNETLQSKWKSASEREIAAGFSYVFAAPGGDVQRPSTVLALTRNIRSSLMSGWVGGDDSIRRNSGSARGRTDELTSHPHAMRGLERGQGQLVLADGSARQSSDVDLGPNGMITQAHINSRGGVAKGNASTAVLR